MQYCKNCGRQLKDGMRFCDRCGQSVRKVQENGQAARHREIRELQEERLNRKKRLAEKEERQRTVREKRRKSRGRRAVIYIFVLLLITLASVLVGYFFFAGKSGSDNAARTGTAVPETTATPSPTEAVVSEGEYAEITVGNVRCPYPAAFHSGSASGNVKMNLTDPLGGAKMVIAQDVMENSLTELAKDYLRQIGATSPTEMKSNDSENSYTVTAEVNGTVYHRKCVLRNNLAVYYDFEYSESSGSAPAYKKYIETIDSRFK